MNTLKVAPIADITKRVADRAHERHGVVARQVPVRIHHERRDSVAPPDPCRAERDRERPRRHGVLGKRAGAVCDLSE